MVRTNGYTCDGCGEYEHGYNELCYIYDAVPVGWMKVSVFLMLENKSELSGAAIQRYKENSRHYCPECIKRVSTP